MVREHRRYVDRMEKISKDACEQLRSAGIPCNGMFTYRGLAEFIQIGKRGNITIEGKEGRESFEYFHCYVPRKYIKKIGMVMKNLGIERYAPEY